MNKYPNLFSSIALGGMKLKNRIVMAPMATNFSSTTGRVTDQQIAYYVERAKGGVGLIITESNYVSLEGRGSVRRLGLTGDDNLAEHRKLVEAIHSHGAHVCAQLHHAGSTAPSAAIGQYPVSCSATILPVKGQPFVGVIPRALTAGEILNLVKAFGAAAQRAKEAGFDAVQVHGAHGYLINQFLSPHFNKRTDSYGGSPTNRMRFLLEIVDEVRNQVGPGFPILTRLSAEEYIDGGYGLEFVMEIARELESHGVNEVSLTCGNYEQLEQIAPIPPYPEGCYSTYSARVKPVTGLAVGVVGRIRTPGLAEEILSSGRADLIYLGRELIADPSWPAKAASGRESDIRPCIYCNRGCFDRMMQGLDIRCTVNYQVGREAKKCEDAVTPLKKVLVIGGGPAGMEAARVAASRGHQVRLMEKSGVLGGQVNLAAVPPAKETLGNLVKYLAVQLTKLGVDVKLNEEATEETVRRLKPDALIVATGAKPHVPGVEGIEQPHVLLAEKVLTERTAPGLKVGVIGGGLVGMEVADFLADQGKQVTVVEMLEDVLLEVGATTKKMMLERVCRKGVRILIETKLLEVREQAIVVERLQYRQTIEMDTVILAAGYKPLDPGVEGWVEKGTAVCRVGDSVKPRNIFDAIHEASEAALSL